MTMKAPKVKIKVNDVTKVFGDDNGDRTVTALDHVGLAVHDQEILCLVGPSGCGKTTLLNIVAGFESATQGSVSLNDKPITKPGPDRSMVFQTPALFPWLTVMGNITFGPQRRGVKAQLYRKAAEDYIEAIGLQGFENHYPYQLSGGMRQRVSIARALISNPEVLLLDEPFGALDAQTRLTMQELLLSIWDKFHHTILFITHDVEEAIFLADRVLVMTRRPGRIKEEISVPIPRPRTYDVLTTEQFVTIKKRVLHLMHEQKV